MKAGDRAIPAGASLSAAAARLHDKITLARRHSVVARRKSFEAGDIKLNFAARVAVVAVSSSARAVDIVGWDLAARRSGFFGLRFHRRLRGESDRPRLFGKCGVRRSILFRRPVIGVNSPASQAE